MTLPLAIGFMGNLAVVLFVLTCLSLILIVLLQKGRGGGLGAAFGGGGAGSLLGTKTGDVLTWITICLVAFFLVLAVLLGKFLRPKGASGLDVPLSTQVGAPAEVDTETDAATSESVDEAVEDAEAAAEEALDIAVDEMQEAADAVAGEEEPTE